MRICFLGGFTGGGTERAAFLLANELSRSHEVFLLSTSSKEPSFPIHGPSFSHLNQSGVPDAIRKIRRFLKRNCIDVLIALEALGGITAVPATRFMKCKLIVWEHANYYQTQGSKYTHFMRRLEMRLADAYVVLTKRDEKNFRTHFRHIRTKLVQIYNIAELSNASSFDPGSKTIISAGHVNAIKNFSIIPEIAQSAFAEHPDWKWKIYGSVAEDAEKLAANIKKFHMEDKVLFCGRCEDMGRAYREASIYVMTSLQEGFPMVLLEARTHGLPIVSFDIETGPDEIVEDGINGFLVKPYDKEAMAQKIEQLIRDDMLQKSFSERAQIGLEQWKAEKIADKWEKLLREL